MHDAADGRISIGKRLKIASLWWKEDLSEKDVTSSSRYSPSRDLSLGCVFDNGVYDYIVDQSDNYDLYARMKWNYTFSLEEGNVGLFVALCLFQ